jgi:hypothetical protein
MLPRSTPLTPALRRVNRLWKLQGVPHAECYSLLSRSPWAGWQSGQWAGATSPECGNSHRIERGRLGVILCAPVVVVLFGRRGRRAMAS